MLAQTADALYDYMTIRGVFTSTRLSIPFHTLEVDIGLNTLQHQLMTCVIISGTLILLFYTVRHNYQTP